MCYNVECKVFRIIWSSLHWCYLILLFVWIPWSGMCLYCFIMLVAVVGICIICLFYPYVKIACLLYCVFDHQYTDYVLWYFMFSKSIYEVLNYFSSHFFEATDFLVVDNTINIWIVYWNLSWIHWPLHRKLFSWVFNELNWIVRWW